MFCIACGTRLPDDAAYCSACGRATHRPEADGATTSAPAAAAAPESLAAGSDEPRVAARRWSEAHGIPYSYEGRWWSRGPSGEVVVWDNVRQDWELALVAQTPFFMRRPRFMSLKTPAIWIFVLSAFFILFTLLALAADIEQAYLANELENGEQVTEERLEDATAVWEGMRGLQGMTIVALAPVILWWTYRATKNVSALGAREPKYSPGWAIGWWFIPIANWVVPFRVFSQAWRASDPALPARENTEWKERPFSDFALVVWVALHVTNFCWSLVLSMWNEPEQFSASERLNWSLAAIAADVALIVVASLGMLVVARLTRRHENANARFDEPAGAVAAPAASAAAQPSY